MGSNLQFIQKLAGETTVALVARPNSRLVSLASRVRADVACGVCCKTVTEVSRTLAANPAASEAAGQKNFTGDEDRDA
ncbi:MAG: hypothetical protein A3C12_03075 [Candidatus Sungbacteria bacterium RIFCSPHIGHO2_02_FULL_49_20]|uniref:Uncharacterized protein n=1 Tax=Candidatus Sungbacteria bacterium RIFCSPHIGHO2_02_FULL_49_20 TaxID=1802272 RepID=A0A1G2KSJ2_9BACT|nr:MAG: hypothetical protein A3C12_03075 [Candidatus Sungbacteria bacterium RIFCSPHIGHO2_02_FULL_49_20]